MATSNEFLLESNRDQKVSEIDTFTEERYGQMFKHLPASAVDILDVGCNTGRGGVVLKGMKKDLRLLGLDCVKERIDAIDRSVYDGAICAFSTEIPVPAGSFDAVVAGEFIEHVPPEQIEPTLAEFFRILRLHGRLILTTPNPNYIKNKLYHLSVLTDKSHVTQHYPDCLRRRLRTVGYSNVKYLGSGRMTRYVGSRVPLLSLYGSYLIRGDKW